MKTQSRRSFLKGVFSGMAGLLTAKLLPKDLKKTGEKDLKEAQFYKKNNLAG